MTTPEPRHEEQEHNVYAGDREAVGPSMAPGRLSVSTAASERLLSQTPSSFLSHPCSPAKALAPGGGSTALEADLGKLDTPLHEVDRSTPELTRQTQGSYIQTFAGLLDSNLLASTPTGSACGRGAPEDEMVLWTEVADNEQGDKCPPGLGSIQPNGRAQVLQAWCASRQESGAPQERGRRPFEAPPRTLLLKAQASAQNLESPELEWSSLSEASRQALRQWVTGHLGGRHCMLIVEQGVSTDSAIGNLGPDTARASSRFDLRGGAGLNVLSGLQAEVELMSNKAGGWLFEAVFAKPPSQVLEEAMSAVLEEIDDADITSFAGVTTEQANLAMRRRSMRAFCDSSCNQADGAPRTSDEYTRTQVWLELLRQHSEGARDDRQAPVAKDKPPKAERPLPWNDGAVKKDFGKTEAELEAESKEMSLDALRVQNRAIEEYVMRLVRQRDELKEMTKMAEERDAYFILGLPGPESDEATVKKAYRDLARKEHPDKAGIQNHKRFQKIQQAYTSIMRQKSQGGGAQSVDREQGEETDGATSSGHKEVCAAVAQATQHATESWRAADRAAKCAHHTLKGADMSASAEVQNMPKRRALRILRDLTRQGIAEMRGAAAEINNLGDSACGIAKCAEVVMYEHREFTAMSVAGVGLRDRAVIVDDVGRASANSSEMLEKIAEATEATLKKVEKASPESGGGSFGGGSFGVPGGSSRGARDESANLVRLGVKLLSESLARTATVARRAADEAISSAIKAVDLSRSLTAMDAEVQKEREKEAAKKRGFDEDVVVVAAPDSSEGQGTSGAAEDDGNSSGEKANEPRTPRNPTTPRGPGSPRDQLKSAAKRVKERHVALRVKNLRFLSNLNEEALGLQARFRSLLQRSEGALLPEVSVVQKRQIFDLVAQMFDFSLSELNRAANSAGAPPAKVLERVLSWALALEHAQEIAMPSESRTQALKLAALVDTDLLCQIVEGPLRHRLLLKIRGHSQSAEGLHRHGRGEHGFHLRIRSGSLGPPSGKAAQAKAGESVQAWEEAVQACCARIVVGVKAQVSPEDVATASATPATR